MQKNNLAQALTKAMTIFLMMFLFPLANAADGQTSVSYGDRSGDLGNLGDGAVGDTTKRNASISTQGVIINLGAAGDSASLWNRSSGGVGSSSVSYTGEQNGDATADEYTAKFSGRSRLTGEEGGEVVEYDWKAEGKYKLAGAKIDKMERHTKSPAQWNDMEEPGDILISDESDVGDDSFRITVTISPSDTPYGVFELVIFYESEELEIVSVYGGTRTYERQTSLFDTDANGQAYAKIRNVNTGKFIEEHPFWVGPAIEVSDVSISLTDGTFKEFGTADGQDNEFDPFYDDVNVGGREGFSITDGTWDAEYVTWQKAQEARDRAHKANVLFTLSKPGKASIAIYRDLVYDLLVDYIESDAIGDENTIPVWTIDNEASGDYYAAVGAYSTIPYDEDGTRAEEQPYSPTGTDHSWRISEDFDIVREEWGATHSYVSTTTTITSGVTPAGWTVLEYTTCGAIIGAAELCPQIALHIGLVGLGTWSYLNLVDYSNGAIPSPGAPAGCYIATDTTPADKLEVINWRQDVYDWENLDDVRGQYNKRTDGYGIQFPSESGRWTYNDCQRGNLDGYSFLDWCSFDGDGGDVDTYNMPTDVAILVGVAPYIFPVGLGGTNTEMVYDPGSM